MSAANRFRLAVISSQELEFNPNLDPISKNGFETQSEPDIAIKTWVSNPFLEIGSRFGLNS